MDFISKALVDYAESHTSDETPLLKKINHHTWQKVYMPRMLSGHLQGRILSMYSKMINPSSILEIGTFTGYSALCLCEGLSKEGKMITIDKNEELEDLVKQYFAESQFSKNIEFMVGDALDIVGDLDETFDLVFIDADKINYIHYYDTVLPKVRKGGIIIADNVLWSGKVIESTKNPDPETVCLQEFNKKVKNDVRVENVLLPVRDGLMVIRKI